jgi:predicted DNA-binding transcriptional regulator AlpA
MSEKSKKKSEVSQKKYLRFRDLQARGIVRNWTTLLRWIACRDFPPGRLLGANTRVWTEEEVDHWIAAAPVTRKAGGE